MILNKSQINQIITSIFKIDSFEDDTKEIHDSFKQLFQLLKSHLEWKVNDSLKDDI